MIILAVDTALSACSVAVYDAAHGTVLAMRQEEMVRGHAERLVPMMGEVMREAGVGFSSLGRLAVTIGPGSFTGLRVGLAAVRAMAQPLSIPAIGVSTLEALAAGVRARHSGVPVLSAIDARHGRVYAQMFADPPGAPALVSLDEIVLQLPSSAFWITGTGANLVAARRREETRIFPQCAPDIGQVARLAAVADPFVSPALPLYLRDADAQPQDKARIARR